MFRTIQDFLESWAHEAEATSKVFGHLTDASLSQKVTPEGRSLGRLAWHITQTLPEMGGRTGLVIEGPGETEPVPTDAAAMARQFQETAESLEEQIRTLKELGALEAHEMKLDKKSGGRGCNTRSVSEADEKDSLESKGIS